MGWDFVSSNDQCIQNIVSVCTKTQENKKKLPKKWMDMENINLSNIRHKNKKYYISDFM